MKDSARIPIERVQPLILWLLDVYGSTAALAEALEVPPSTIRTWIGQARGRCIAPRNALKISQFVQSHRRPQDMFGHRYENPVPARRALTFDQEMARRDSKSRVHINENVE